MAFVQQGPRRNARQAQQHARVTNSSELYQHDNNHASPASAAAATQHESKGRLLNDPGVSSRDFGSDWSVVFPGKAKNSSTTSSSSSDHLHHQISDHDAPAITSREGRSSSQDRDPSGSSWSLTEGEQKPAQAAPISGSRTDSWPSAFSLLLGREADHRPSHTLAPLHDGTGQFGDSTITHASSLESTTTFDANHDLFFDYSYEGSEDELDLRLTFDEEDAASTSASSTTPPSLLLSGGSTHQPSHASEVERTPSSSSRASWSGRSRSVTASAHSDDDGDLFGESSEWSWQINGSSRVLASTTPRQQSPDPFIEKPSRNTVKARVSQDRGMDDSALDADLSLTPFAISAGLAPRARVSSRSARQSDVSGSQISSGFKRRHRRQDLGDESSVRSSKSRRSDGYAATSASRKSASDKLQPRSSRKPSFSSTRPHHRPHHQRDDTGHASASQVPLSRRHRATRLLAKIFDVDSDVLDAVLEDRGPLALTSEELADASVQGHARPFVVGTEADHLTNTDSTPPGWRELIDGRLVQDDENEEPGPYEGPRAEANSTGSEHNPILALARADWSGFSSGQTNSVASADEPTIQDALKHALSQLRGGELITSSVVLNSAVEALHGVMPYFVPFSWRLLARVMRDWRGPEHEEMVDPPAKASSTNAPSSNDAASSVSSLTEGKVASLPDESPTQSSHKVAQWRERSNSLQDDPASSRQLVDSFTTSTSTWSLARRSVRND